MLGPVALGVALVGAALPGLATADESVALYAQVCRCALGCRAGWEERRCSLGIVTAPLRFHHV